jgi:hypothetical protein
VSTFRVTYKDKDGAAREFVWDSSRELEMWDRIIKKFTKPVSPDELLRFERIRNKWKIPKVG